MNETYEQLFGLLRTAFGIETASDKPLTEQQWLRLYQCAVQQSLTGVVYQSLSLQRPQGERSMEILMQWLGDAEAISGLNRLLNAEAARLTGLFEAEGHHTAILKGQANARLYPNPLSRQPGDIDIWVDGGLERVTAMLRRLGLADEKPMPEISLTGENTTSYHHIHLATNDKGIDVEVHFRPSSGNMNPFTNRRLQRWLEQEIQTTISVDEGFRVPTIPFALIMQLAHIQRHFLSSGLGLRQVCDYYWLLRHATADDRQKVSQLLRPFGLRHMAEALMWVLGSVLRIDSALMIASPDERRGRWMLSEIMANGNFGQFSPLWQKSVWRRFFFNRLHRLQMMRFDWQETLWIELGYWKSFILRIPLRIKYRRLSLMPDRQYVCKM